MKRLWPGSLAGQLIVLLLGALVLAQAVTAVIFIDERAVAIRAAGRDLVLARTAAVVRLLEETPPELHDRVLTAASWFRLAFTIGDESAVPADGSDDGAAAAAELHLAAALAELIGDDRDVRVRIFEGEDPWPGHRRPHPPHGEPPGDDRPLPMNQPRPPIRGLALAVALDDGHWLNVEATVPTAPSRSWLVAPLIFTVLMAVAILVIAALTVRRITRPLRALAAAADRLGRGDSASPLAETGPEDIRRTTRAFNAMQARLARFMADRTRMLAAISHDLRTPITTLRLRAEFIDDAETRDRIMATLEEMSRMTEATLAFSRDESMTEETRVVDLAALAQSLADDMAELDQDVAFTGPDRLAYPCRPVALKRAIRNLVENAVRYGQRARVCLEALPDGPRLTVEDDGPGIPEDRLAEVFEPFVRLEASRSRETGGVGLGLAIARSIVHAHGGDLVLVNRPGGGVAAILTLPPTTL
ncbi:MAG: HAMP domain-containing protein [Rhodospirillaceae bacterium]|nr:HAMP domain-containing protein [Rhodospirillaceae bacterium]